MQRWTMCERCGYYTRVYSLLLDSDVEAKQMYLCADCIRDIMEYAEKVLE